MGILKDFDKGKLDALRTLSYDEFNSKGPAIQKKFGNDYNAITSRLTDLERFAKIVISKPGLKFQGNQALLQQVETLQNLRKGIKKGGGGVDLKALKKKAISTAVNNVTTTASILAQVPLNGTGTHFIKGLVPTGYLQGTPPESALGNFLQDQGGLGGGVNAAAIVLDGGVVPTNAQSNFTDGTEGEVNTQSALSLEAKKAKKAAKDIFDLLTAPQRPAVGGLSNENPPTYPLLGEEVGGLGKIDPETGLPQIGKTVNIPTSAVENRSTFNVENMKKTGDASLTTLNKDVTDTKDPLHKDTSGVLIKNKFEGKARPINYVSKMPEGIEGTDYTKGNTTITLRGRGIRPELKESDKVNLAGVNSGEFLGDTAKDMIPFYFETVMPGLDSKFLHFRAFLDSFSDNYTGEWTGTKYIGRAEDMYTYSGFSRDITFDFKIAAFSKKELVPLYNKLNLLAATTAPSYGETGSFMKGTLTAVTIGDYLKRQDGFIKSVGITWQQGVQWEIDSNSLQVPHGLDVSISFQPIHKFNPVANLDLDTQKYIG